MSTATGLLESQDLGKERSSYRAARKAGRTCGQWGEEAACSVDERMLQFESSLFTGLVCWLRGRAQKPRGKGEDHQVKSGELLIFSFIFLPSVGRAVLGIESKVLHL